jgi:hypothetical protein
MNCAIARSVAEALGNCTFDINDEGQVHTYLRYLRDLPYKGQLYWKAFNEAASSIKRRSTA